MPNSWIFLIVTLSSLIKGITGFGFALFSFPLLLIWYTPKEIIPVLMIGNLIASILIVMQKKDKRLLDRNSHVLIASGGLFTLLGVWALSASSGTALVHITGILFIALTLLSLFHKKQKENPLTQKSYVLAGVIIGFITGAVSVSGPPLALFLNKANIDNRKFREVFAWFSVVTAIIAILGYYHQGLLTREALWLSTLFTPILLAGTVMGKRINALLSISQFQTINIVLTLISSILLILN
jgi:uncharacterized protein